jgi:hypothetical protein
MSLLRAAFAFTPAESKRLIGRAVARLPEVQAAFKNDLIVVAHGSTNVYVAEELMGRFPDGRERGSFLSGHMFNGVMCQTAPMEKGPMIVLDKGKVIPPAPMMDKVLAAGGPGSIFIKGANAVDSEGNAGVFCAHPGCGTIGFAYGYISGRGVKLIVPVGLEKAVASVKAACNQLGHDNLYYALGQKIGMMPMFNAKVVTEVTALKVLFDLDAVHVGGGGVTGSEGSVVLVATGTKAQIDAAVPHLEAIKGEPPLKTMKNFCADCVPTTPAMAGTVKEQAGPAAKLTCLYAGKREEELPKGFIRRPETV